MTIYGVALLAFCYLAGMWMGEGLAMLIRVKSNVGGVGFGMILLILFQSWPLTKKWLVRDVPSGIAFWSRMYIPVVVAMSAIQNARMAFSSGYLAILAGILPTALCFMLIPAIAARYKNPR